MKRYLFQIAVALDQLLNTLFGGYADETLSARAYRRSADSYRWTLVRNVIDAVLFFDPNHCEVAYDSEKARRHLPPEYRE